MDRFIHNSGSLRQRFAAIYRQFFLDYPLVASASNSFLWSGEFAGFHHGIVVVQKLPLSSLVGFKPTPEPGVRVLADHLTYEPDGNCFRTRTLDPLLQQAIKQFVESNYSSIDSGLEIGLLTESPLGHGLGANASIGAALSLLVWPEKSIDFLVETTRQFLRLCQGGYSSGATAYAALCDDLSPLVIADQAGRWKVVSLDHNSTVWPLDFGLIYSGTQADSHGVTLANDNTMRELGRDSRRVNRWLKTSAPQFRETLINMLNATSGLVVSALDDLLRRGSTNQALERLFNSLNQYQNLLHVLNMTDNTADLIYAAIHRLANKQSNGVGSGVKISGIGKGGALLFALPYGGYRSEMIDLIEQIRIDTGRRIWLDYASWLDGLSGSAARIEQNIERGLYSNFVQGDGVGLITIVNGKLFKQVVASERVAELSQQYDLVVDAVLDKISVSGRAMSSKEMPSQKATVEIILKLLKSDDFTLTNQQLPGSYGQSRYDLQGKIVQPLIRQIHELSGRDLLLEISGGSYEHFNLSLNPAGVSIALIEKKI